jgi:SAM-dependent methyltransferase
MLGEQDIYRDGRYSDNNPTWHAEDGSGKAADLLPAVQSALSGREHASILEVGCGTGALLSALREHLGAKASYTGIDIAPEPVRIGTAKHSGIELRVQDFLSFEDRVTVAIFSDVFEHLENPLAFIRHARDIADFLVVRQPLQGDFGMFRTGGYASAIERLGHVQFFSSRSFIALAALAGWEPHDLDLLAPWELKTHKGGRPNPLKRWFADSRREYASMLTSGFYLVGSFH